MEALNTASSFYKTIQNKENNDLITLYVSFMYDVLCAYQMSDSK